MRAPLAFAFLGSSASAAVDRLCGDGRLADLRRRPRVAGRRGERAQRARLRRHLLHQQRAIGGGGSLSVAQLHTSRTPGTRSARTACTTSTCPPTTRTSSAGSSATTATGCSTRASRSRATPTRTPSYAGTAQQSAAACGFTSARAGWELNIGASCGQTCAESIPPRNRWAVRTFKPVDVETSVADLQDQVLNALNHGGGWVPIMFHDICSNCGFYAMSTADLNAFLDWLATQPVRCGRCATSWASPPSHRPCSRPRRPRATPPTCCRTRAWRRSVRAGCCRSRSRRAAGSRTAPGRSRRSGTGSAPMRTPAPGR